MDKTFFALSHPVRRTLLERLAASDLSVGEAARGLAESPSQITKHLRILEQAGLLARHREGRVHRLHFEPAPLAEAFDWVARHRDFWRTRFDALDAYLNRMEATDD
ncbi:MAG: helix-turn-helix transcriptional regulator [Rhodocyclaceae bacterium]|nr:helix-turn-helix transcriptional regulator [Rhodocyclaceae bacterium]